MDDAEQEPGGPDDGESTAEQREELNQLTSIVFEMALSYALSGVGSLTAKDIAQDICIALWKQWLKSPAQFRPPENLRSYVASAVRRGIRGFLRARGRQSAREKVFAVAYENAASQAMNTQLVVYQRELRRRVLRALRAMSRPRREVFQLAKKDGLRQAEIAKRRGLSIRTVQHHVANVSRELKALADQYRQEGAR